MLLASCGGGGGGGSSDAPAVSVTADQSALSFVGFTGQAAPPQQTINLTLHGGSGSYYGAVKTDQPNILSATFTPTSDTTATLSLTPTSLAPNTASGSITFLLCNDPGCQQVAWSLSIPYTIDMFTIDASGITLTGYEGTAGTATKLAISPPDAAHKLSMAATSQGATSWLSAVRNSDSEIDVSSSAVGLTKGSYTGSVLVSLAGNAATLTIPVSFTVGDGIVAPPARSLDWTANATGGSLSGSASIAFQGAQTPTWTAVSDQAWLTLTHASGIGAGSVQYAADITKLGGMANWSSSTATVTVSAAGLSSASFQVSLNKKLPEVLTASPNPLIAGRVTTLHAFGKGFSQLADGSQFQVSGATGTTGTIVSDTEAVLTVQALPAGNASVSASNAAGIATAAASVSVVNLSALSYATAANTGEKRWAIFDPARNAVYAINITQNTLVRYRLVSGAWQVDGLPITTIGDMAFSPDRKTLYVGSGLSNLLAIDPDTLQIRGTYTLSGASPYGTSLSPNFTFTKGMAVTNNLRVWFGGSQWASMGYFDMRTNTFGSLQSASFANGSLYSPEFYASGDGSKMLAVQYGISPTPVDILYTSATDSLANTTLPQTYNYALLSQDGSKVLLDSTSLYRTSDYTLIGTVKTSGAGIGTAAALSPDGTRVYRLVSTSQNSLTIDHIDVLDTTQVVPGKSEFVNVGQIHVTDQALDCGASPPYGCDVNGAFAISPLGNTLFWVGNQRLVVIPIPSGMSSIASVRTSLLPAATR